MRKNFTARTEPLPPIGTNLTVKTTCRYGRGVFAASDIAKGTVIHVLSGERITLDEFVNRIFRGEERLDDPLQIGRRTYLDLDEFSRLFNHACEPNAGLRKTSELFALRNIRGGEEIVYDYSATIAPTVWQMRCACHAGTCRKILGDIRSIPRRQLETYKQAGALQRYMKPLLKEIETGSYELPAYERRALEKLGEKASSEPAFP